MMLALVSSLLYLSTAASIWLRPSTGAVERTLPVVALLMHGGVLAQQAFQGGGLTIGATEALSLFAWQAALLLWVVGWREPVRALGLAVYPLAGLAVALMVVVPTVPTEIAVASWKTRSHVVLSLFSAGLLTLAAVHALLLATQERLLRDHRLTHLTRALPPLQTMERLLFQFIGIGFLLLSLTLLSGLWFVRDWLAQHLAHKTVLSISAWLIFGVLLWGRLRHGWRGRTAIRWTLAGYATLIVAYFGSKLILEEILGRHWG